MGISVILQEGQISKDMCHIYKYTKYSTSIRHTTAYQKALHIINVIMALDIMQFNGISKAGATLLISGDII